MAYKKDGKGGIADGAYITPQDAFRRPPAGSIADSGLSSIGKPKGFNSIVAKKRQSIRKFMQQKGYQKPGFKGVGPVKKTPPPTTYPKFPSLQPSNPPYTYLASKT